MNELKKCLEYLGARSKGRRTKGTSDTGDLLLEIERFGGRAGWAVGRWRDSEGYFVAMDPNVGGGTIVSIKAYWQPGYADSRGKDK